MKFKLRRRCWFPWIIVACCSLGIGLLFFPDWDEPAVLIGALALLGGLVGFLYAEHSRGTQAFRELFREFNERYDWLNDDLNAIRSQSGEELNEDDRDILMDYFNLCAEEHMYFRAGFIDPSVWRAWCTGMMHFYREPRIAELWNDELRQAQESYYGFDIETVRECAGAARRQSFFSWARSLLSHLREVALTSPKPLSSGSDSTPR